MSFAALAIYSITTFAVELPPIFYPLTLQTEGKFLAAKQLFPGEEGGLWSIDVHDKVRFFDGSRFVELNGASFNSRTVTFADGRFYLTTTPTGGWEFPAMWIFVSGIFMLAGGGKLSVDYLLRKKLGQNSISLPEYLV